ncbi:hypothetical protein P153DRAFT_366590 [Dothidotthia symphoricarpi CBS 119687]|uniref:Uncharacterized protein n=1 Tax=Dothidotthia symphoricarpi CBS 119687 TaxID=1392245 RepID=A0A6A6AI58_9PLEO|nr:uncharacterized protein P153DRAFT_366590 [Dothidotthia symphoricarpi CBS 119687]KAF2130121.1 hypothetical protein P153DRAFT_366590 [Dothidotthia symphoricarpi CBS 119687]
MSSANPFRASPPPSNAPFVAVPQASLSTPDSTPEAREDGRFVLDDTISLPPRTKKHVRIESSTVFIPPQSNIDSPDMTAYAALTPPLGATHSMTSPFPTYPAGWSDERIQAAQDARVSSWSSPGASQPTPYPSGVPANPFSRTLATIEPQEQEGVVERTAAEGAVQSNNRASLDVESFKNLLLTGRPSARPSAQSPKTAASTISSAPIFESSSSTDTSISRQSLFDHSYEAHAESPRTSYEMAASDEDERNRLVSEVRKEKKQPPPAPKPRHGKPVAPRQPQTVSFDDFAVNVPAPAPVSRQNSFDTNKPLPPTPVASQPPLHITTQDSTQHQPAPVELRLSDTPSTSDVLHSQKRAPPPVPLARRQSQLRSSVTSNRSRSSSSITMSSQVSIDAVLPSPSASINDPMSSIKSPPPPPPRRHGARLANMDTSSANSSTTELPQRSTSVRTTASSQGPSSSRRSTIDSEPAPSVSGVNRTSSISSTRNPTRTTSGESTGSTMQSPPPLPPPRRRQSNRSSLDQQRPHVPSSPTESRRTSMENRRTSVESKRRTSGASESSLRHVYAPADEKFTSNDYALYSPREEVENILGAGVAQDEGRKDSTSILDDMERFQREIDELRAKFTQAG